jgi:hypothetical protein
MLQPVVFLAVLNVHLCVLLAVFICCKSLLFEDGYLICEAGIDAV